jgi:aldose sugar dehydrogenase
MRGVYNHLKAAVFVTGWMFLILMPLAAQEPLPQTFTHGEVTYTVERYLRADYPVSIAFAPDGRMFYTEKNTGSVRVVSPEGVLQAEPVITLPTSGLVERGMLGIAFDPAYEENGHIWVFHTAEGTARDWPANNVVRFKEEDGVGIKPEIMLSVPLSGGTLIHNGGNLHFDSDDLLYVSYGNYEDERHSQDLDTIPGAIHRFAITDEGLVPAPDNPFEDSSVYAYGLRNAFDFAFDTEDTGFIFATENGQDCDDEINLILPGFNYGAGPGYRCGGTSSAMPADALYLPGLLTFTPTVAPTGIIVYGHEAVPQWQGKVFYCTWNLQKLTMITLNDARNTVLRTEDLPTADMPCRIGLAVGPEGGLYWTGVGADGGAIYRLLPQS